MPLLFSYGTLLQEDVQPKVGRHSDAHMQLGAEGAEWQQLTCGR